MKSGASANLAAAWYVMGAGVVAALHVGKLPPALPVLQQVLGISLLQAGFLVSLVQLAGMTLGLVTGLAVQRVGLRRSMVAGLLVLCGASALGAFAQGPAWLLALRAVEGLGFLWVVLPAPALVRQLVPPDRLQGMLGMWGAYMPLGASLALLAGPWVLQAGTPDTGWRLLWWLLSALAAALAALLWWRVPSDRSREPPFVRPHPERHQPASRNLLALTLRSRAAWLLAMSFAMYSGQWLAVVGFLPSIYSAAGVAGLMVAWLTALAAAVNMVGNIAAGRLLARGMSPVVLLGAGFLAMASGAMVAFGPGIQPWVQYAAVLVFSMVGGLIPATLFNLAVRLAPGRDTVSATVGWVQQWSALGQFAGPPLVAWVAVRAGGWHWTGGLAAACCAMGLLLTVKIHGLLLSGHPAVVPAIK